MAFGWDIDRTAYIGRSVILVRHLSMGPGASIGPLNVIRDLEELRLGEGASIATRNWIPAFRRLSSEVTPSRTLPTGNPPRSWGSTP